VCNNLTAPRQLAQSQTDSLLRCLEVEALAAQVTRCAAQRRRFASCLFAQFIMVALILLVYICFAL
jgi:hypothetical protein